MFAHRVAVALTLVALFACGGKKEETKDDAAPGQAQSEPAPDKERSFLAKGCEVHSDAAKKANCLCRVDVMDATLSPELLAKLETAPKGPSDAVIEHLGGPDKLSTVYEAMRKASSACGQGASK